MDRDTLLLISIGIAAIVLACVAKAGMCSQEMYDRVYENIVQTAIDAGATQKAIDDKNNTVEALRELCKGQLSTYETGKLIRFIEVQ